MRQIRFSERFVPPTTTHHAKRIGFVTVGGSRRARLHDSPALVGARELYAAMFAPHRPREPLTGPISLTITIVWPFRRSESKSRRVAGRWRRMDRRPDASNVAKTIEDVLASLRFIDDDARITDLVVRKRWGAVPGVTIALQEEDEWLESER